MMIWQTFCIAYWESEQTSSLQIPRQLEDTLSFLHRILRVRAGSRARARQVVRLLFQRKLKGLLAHGHRPRSLQIPGHDREIFPTLHFLFRVLLVRLATCWQVHSLFLTTKGSRLLSHRACGVGVARIVGLEVGLCDGLSVGLCVARIVGLEVGPSDGLSVGLCVGSSSSFHRELSSTTVVGSPFAPITTVSGTENQFRRPRIVLPLLLLLC